MVTDEWLFPESKHARAPALAASRSINQPLFLVCQKRTCHDKTVTGTHKRHTCASRRPPTFICSNEIYCCREVIHYLFIYISFHIFA